MAGEKATLKAALLAAFNDQINVTTPQPTPITQLSEAQANAIVDMVIAAINATLVVPLLVAPAGGGPVTGTITLQSTAS
jgi:hypothetical protein